MFYRYNKANCQIPMDLENLYQGSCFLAGGSPVLLQENLKKLDQPGVMVASMNNTASVVPTDIWICGDRPICYSPRILRDQKLMKFANLAKKNYLAANYIDWKFIANTYFYDTTPDFNKDNFLKSGNKFAWWKNTFYIAIQILNTLGFRKIYLIGCQFKVKGDKQYAYDVKLNPAQQKWNTKTYSYVVADMKTLKPTFERKGLEVVSCTPESPLNEHYPFMKMDDAIDEMLKDYPKQYELSECMHSSAFSKGD